MGSYNCCTSRDPPSPDSLPSRPYFGKSSSKDPPQINSWSTTSTFSRLEDAAELRAIFENDKLVSDDESTHLMTRKSTSTLKDVKSKFKKHLSRDSIISKHWLRPTFVIDDDYNERNKEMELVRNHRRQQELNSESSYDEDARPLATVTSNINPSRVVESTYPRQTARPGITYQEVTKLLLSRQKSEAGIFDLRKASSPSHTKRRIHSLGTINGSKGLENMSGCTGDILRSFIPTISQAPALGPPRLTSIVDSTTRQTSWRLSFASVDRAGQLRALSQEYKPSRPDFIPDIKPGEIFPPKRFRSHSMSVLTLAAAKLPSHSSESQALPTDAIKPAATNNYRDVDSSDEAATSSLHLHEMQISRRLASKGLYSSSSPQVSSWGSRSNLSGWYFANRVPVQGANSPKNHFRQTTSSEMIIMGDNAYSEDMVLDVTSPFYPSVQNSVRPTRQNCQLQLPQHEIEDSESQLKNRDLGVIAYVPDFGIKVSGNSLKRASIGKYRDRRTSSPLFDSETYSFKEREDVLDGNESRLPNSLTRSRHITRVRSKFKEDFGDSQTTAHTAKQYTTSLFRALQIPRATRLVPRSPDGVDFLELGTPRGRAKFRFSFSDYKFSPVQSMSPGVRNSFSGTPDFAVVDPLDAQHDTTESIWVNAIKKTRGKLASQFSIQRSNSTKGRIEGTGSLQFPMNQLVRLKGEQVTIDDSTDEKSGHHVPVVSDGDETFKLDRILRGQARPFEEDYKILDKWVDELKAHELQAKAKTVTIRQAQHPPHSTLSPESWAKYPSHTREERTGSASVEENISLRDFAVKEMKDGVTEWWTSERKHHHHHQLRGDRRSLPTRLSYQIRDSLYKLQIAKNILKDSVIHGRKSSVSVAGELEYPELEMLPGETSYERFDEVEVTEGKTETKIEIAKTGAGFRKVVLGQGGSDMEGEEINVGDALLVDIADPKFYNDCVSLPPESDGDEERIGTNSARITLNIEPQKPLALDNPFYGKKKCQTWSGRDRAAQRFRGLLRRSTIDFQVELEKIEKLERDRLIRAAENAWGSDGNQHIEGGRSGAAKEASDLEDSFLHG